METWVPGNLLILDDPTKICDEKCKDGSPIYSVCCYFTHLVKRVVHNNSEASSERVLTKSLANFIEKNEDLMIEEMIEEKMGLLQDLALIDSGYRADQNGGRIPALASFTCRDIGIDCQFEAQASTDQALMRIFIAHAESDHNMRVLSADVILRIQNAIKR